jgi:1-acyl-sn-glycerol-3-phosphate acyltransferase
LASSSHEHLKAPGPVQLHTTRLIAEVGIRAIGGLSTSNEDNIRNVEGAYVQAANHHSLIDIPAVGNAAHRVARQQLHYIAKNDLDIQLGYGALKIDIGDWLEGGGTIFIDREIGLTAENHTDIASRAKRKAAFATWPEGHRYHGRLKKEHIMSLVIVPLVFEHNLSVVPVGIAGTEPGDVGFLHVAYGQPFKPGEVEFEADQAWDHRRRPAMLAKAIKSQLGKDAIDAFMEDLYQGMQKAETEAIERRKARMAKRHLSRTILLPITKGSGKLFKEKKFELQRDT